MVVINIKIKGLNKLSKLILKAESGMARTLQNTLREAAFMVEKAGKKRITSGPTRAIDIGILKGSINVAEVTPFSAIVRVRANYGIYVHEGTRYMRARPFMTKAVDDTIKDIEKLLEKNINALLK